MLRMGLSEDQIEGWAREGRLQRALRGVYLVGATALDDRGRIAAAVLACGPGTVTSHRSAAWLLGIGAKNPAVVDVIPPGQAGRKIDGIKVHKVPRPGPGEVVRVHGILCTGAARTVVDLAGTYGDKELRGTVERAAMLRMLDLGAIDGLLADGPMRRGAPGLRRVLAEWRPVAETAKFATVRSLFEAKLLPLIAKAELPMPRINAPVRTAERILEVDLLWEHERFVVEADSRRFHATEVAFERDHRRDRELLAAGYAVQRVTWREAEKEADAVLATIRGELAARSGRG